MDMISVVDPHSSQRFTGFCVHLSSFVLLQIDMYEKSE